MNAEIQATIKSDPCSYPSLLKLMSTSASADVRLAAKLALQRLSSAPSGVGNMSDEADKRVHEAIAAEEKRTAKATATANKKAAKKEASKTGVKTSQQSGCDKKCWHHQSLISCCCECLPLPSTRLLPVR